MTSRLSGVLHHIRDGLKTAGPSDGQLLERYLARRDEAAFAAIVRRHGPMVLGVCRRVLRNVHDADDAFQATFLVLVKKAAAVRPRELVGHWLYGVAHRTALKAKALAAKRGAKERRMPPPESRHDEPPADWLPLLDEELQRLPDKYRLPLVLCDLDGKTRKQAARQLGWPDGTLSTRLTRARVLLAQRLTRRGVTLAGGTAALAALGGNVSAALLSSTVRAAMGFAAGHAATAVSANVATLTQGVLKTMLLSKLKLVAAVGMVLTLLGIGLGAGAYRGNAGEPADPPPASPKTPHAVSFADGDTTEAVEPKPASSKLPLSPMPTQALVSITRTGTIAVTTRSAVYQARTTLNQWNEPITSYRLIDRTTTEQYSRDDVRVYDTAGKRVAAKELPRLFKEEVTALVYVGVDKPDSLHLKLFKDGTLFLVLPAPAEPEATNAPPRMGRDRLAPVTSPPPTEPETKMPPTSDEQQKLLKDLQGEWRMVTLVENDRKHEAFGDKDFRMSIAKNQVQLGPKEDIDGDKVKPKLLSVTQGASVQTFDLIDPKNETRVSLGIYKQEGDALVVCLAQPGGERPANMTSKEGSGRMLMYFRRVSVTTPP
jgi:RNA polymerase sigma factor (sigma-70 family)